jgi:two-component system, cell cycle sensor histidine kinase and response regulator CckA
MPTPKAGNDGSSVQNESVGLVLEAMLESVAFHELVRDPLGRPVDYRILDCNPAFTTITGIARGAAIGHMASELYGRVPFLDVYARVAESGRPERFETDYLPLGLHLAISVVSPRPGTFATIASDVTERHRALQLLRRYQLLAGSSSDVFLFVRRDDGRILEVNAAALAAYGYSPEEMLGLTLFDLRERGTRGATDALMAATDDHDLRFETVHRRKDGSTFPVEVSCTGVVQDGTRILVGVIRDISERKRAEAWRAAERERLDVTLRSIGDAVIATDEAARITLLNGVAETLTGWTAAEALGRPLLEVFRIIGEETRRPSEDPVSRVLREGTVIGLANNTLLIARDGTERAIADSGAPIRDAEGKTIGVVLVFRDQAKERAYERSLHEALDRVERSERRYRLLADHAHDVIWKLDLTSLRYAYVSPSITSLRGLTVEEALAEPVERSLTPESLVRVQAVMARIGTPAEENPHTDIYDQPCKDGTVKHVEITTTLVRDADGRAVEVVGVSRDATTRVEAERALRARKDELRTIHDASLDGIFIIDWTGRILQVNDVACVQTGYSREELLSMSGRDLEAAESPSEAEAHLERILTKGWGRFETRHRRKDGSLIDVELSIQYSPSDGGRFIGFAKDITQPKAAERALRESESRLRAVFDQAAVGVVHADTSTSRFIAANAKFCELLGYSREEVMARTWRDLTHPEDLAADLAGLARVLGSGESHRREKRYIRKDGSVVWADVTVNRIAMPGEAPISQVVAIVEDVSERKQAEETARRSENRFRALIEKSSDAIQVLGVDGRVSFWSQSSAEVLGWTSEEALGRLAVEFIHEVDRPRFGAALEKLISNAGSTERETFRFQHKDGCWRHLEVVGRSLLDDPAVAGVVLNTRDMTAQRQLEDQFRQAQKLESVGRLAGGVAHDFNNLLTVILGCSEALSSMVRSNGNALLEVEDIRGAGERARDLTGQLLAFARKQVISPVLLDLNAVVHRSERMLHRLLGEDIELEVVLGPQPWSIHADPSQAEQVLLNLAVNARDAMPRGGKLVLETRNRTVGEREAGAGSGLHAGDWVQLIVRDTGSGMAPEVQAHLFEPFFTTKEQGKGTGLGLATVYGIVTQAGGHVHVESEPGHGTTFLVCFPRAEGPAAEAPLRPSTASTRGTEQVLVVEDDAMVRSVILRTLAGEGYQVTAISHAPRALSLTDAELGRTELLVTDVVMPGMDGHALAEELVRRKPTLKVLYLSGYTQDVISERGVLEAGLNFLSKPFTGTALLTKVRAVLDAK